MILYLLYTGSTQSFTNTGYVFRRCMYEFWEDTKVIWGYKKSELVDEKYI